MGSSLNPTHFTRNCNLPFTFTSYTWCITNLASMGLQRAFFRAEICTISAQNPQCLHKSLHQNQTKKARKCDNVHVATKARNHHITEAFSCQKSTFLQQKQNKKYQQNDL